MPYESPLVPRAFDGPTGIDLGKLALKLGPAIEQDHALLAAIEAVRMAPENSAELVALGDKLSRIGAHEKAQTAYEDALLNDPHNLEALQGIALALRGQARDSDDKDLMLRAISAFELLAARTPSSPGPLMFIATSWNYLANAEKVAESAKRVLEISPDNTIAWEFLGHASMRLREFDRAAEAFGKAMELETQDEVMLARTDLLAAQGRALFLGNHVEDAASLLLRATRLDPRNIENYNWLALCFNDLRREMPQAVTVNLPAESEDYPTPVFQMPEKLREIYFEQLRSGQELPIRSSTKYPESLFINLAVELRSYEKITYQIQVLPAQDQNRDCWAQIENQKSGYRLLFLLPGAGTENRALLQAWRGLNLVRARRVEEAVDLLAKTSAASEVLVLAAADFYRAITGEDRAPNWVVSLGSPQDALHGVYKTGFGIRVLNAPDRTLKADLRIFVDRDRHATYGLEVHRLGPDGKVLSALKSERLGLVSDVAPKLNELAKRIIGD